MAKVGKFCLAKRVKVEWLFHTVAGIECGQLVYENAGRIIHIMNFECLAEHLHLDKGRQGIYARFLVHGLE